MKFDSDENPAIHVDAENAGKDRQIDLLTRIKDLTGTAYLSDLHSGMIGSVIGEAAGRVSPKEYTVREWEDAISYILNIDCPHFENVYEAQRFLCEQVRPQEK